MAAGPGGFGRNPSKNNEEINAIRQLAADILETSIGNSCLNNCLTFRAKDGSRLEKFQLSLWRIRDTGSVGNYANVFSKSLRTLDFLQKSLRKDVEFLGEENASDSVPIADGIENFVIPKIKELAGKLGITLVEYDKRTER